MEKPYSVDVELSEDQYVSDDSIPTKPKGKNSAENAAPAKSNVRHIRGKKKNNEDLVVDVTRQLMVKQREMVASEFEQYYLSKNLPVEVELSGPDKTYISLSSVLFCNDSVGRLVEKTNLFHCLKEAGFEKVALGDSEERIWAYDLKNQ